MRKKRSMLYTAAFISVGIYSVIGTFKYHSLKNRHYEASRENRSLLSQSKILAVSLSQIFEKIQELNADSQFLVHARELHVRKSKDYKPSKMESRDPLANFRLKSSFVGGKSENFHRLNDIEIQAEQLFSQVKNTQEQIRTGFFVLRSIPSIFPAQGRINSLYGHRVSPVTGHRKIHKGVDIVAQEGTPVFAAADGVVRLAAQKGNYGNFVQIGHGLDFRTHYAHLQEYFVKRGDLVEKGQVIGTVGQTGSTTGAHLHYEIWLDNAHLDPMYFLPGRVFQKDLIKPKVAHIAQAKSTQPMIEKMPIGKSRQTFLTQITWITLGGLLSLFLSYYIIYRLFLLRIARRFISKLEGKKSKDKPVRYW